MDASVDKGNALRQLQQYLGIKKEETMAFGDNNNDIGMMLAAGESYAVETAVKEVKEAAGNICPGYLDKGVYKIIKNLLQDIDYDAGLRQYGIIEYRHSPKRKEDVSMHEFDDAVLQCFLKNQGQLFPEGDVVSNLEEAENFLEECFAVVVNSVEEVWEYFEEEGVDMDGAEGDEILEADEVFDIGDGRYLIVEG